MTELRSHARELLDASRQRRTPRPESKARLVERLVETAAQTAHDSPTKPPLAQRLSNRAKLVVLASLLAAVATALYLASRH